MPYRSLGEHDLDFSVEQAAFVGFFAGMAVLVSEVALGGILGLLVFAVVMSVLFRDVRVVLSWAIIVALIPAIFIGTGLPYGIGILFFLIPALLVGLPILLLPGFGEQGVLEFGAIVTAGVVGAMVVGLMLSSPETLEEDFWILKVFFMGFPVFGGAYAAAVTKLYESGEVEG